MKKIIYNTGLVLVLMAIFAMPLMGFGFISENNDNETSNVLGATTVVKKQPELAILEQFDYEVVLAKDSNQQTLYDVMPVAYINGGNKFLVVIPTEYKELGVTARIEKKESSLDLIFNSDELLSKSLNIPATILVLN